MQQRWKLQVLVRWTKDRSRVLQPNALDTNEYSSITNAPSRIVLFCFKHLFRGVNAREEIWQGCAYVKTGTSHNFKLHLEWWVFYRESVTTSIDSYPFSPSSPWAQALPSRYVRCSWKSVAWIALKKVLVWGTTVTFFSVTRRSRSDESHSLSQWVDVLIDLTDVTLVSDDTYRRLYWCDPDHPDDPDESYLVMKVI